MSVSPTCGVRDHAMVLAEALTRENVSYSLHWLNRSGDSLRTARSQVRAWTRELAAELDRARPDAVLLHYSVFAQSYRGLPLFVGAMLSALRSSRTPIVTVAHELAYPWGHGGIRGRVWASTQRALLIDVIRTSAAVIVTADFRAEWLASRPWLPRRPVTVTPVFSNLPPPRSGSHPEDTRPVVGLFGYSYEGVAIPLVLDAALRLKDRGVEMRLMLLGAPGRSSSSGEAWLAAARSRDLADTLSFSGTLSPQDLSDALASCHVLLFTDASGPSSRKGTLAASLASGRPVIAIDGPRRWSELIQCEAARVVQPTPDALTDALDAILADEHLRETLGARGREFAEQRMSVARSVDSVTALLEEIVGARG
jgi:glycosyltransferase involved in cell wall biosynthesis